MAGHSKFKNIMHRKGAQDKKRSAAFSKLSREITVAAKSGMPDPDMNPRLRLAVNNARAASMPKDNIQRAIDKAGAGEGEDYEEIRYEGYGPGGVALIVEALTDNRNRTATNVRTAFAKNGGNLGASGAVSHGFERLGLIEYPASVGDEEKVLEAAIEAGADDVESDEDTHQIWTAIDNLHPVSRELEKALVLTLTLANFTTTTPGPTLSTPQQMFLMLVSCGLYIAFLAVQTGRHRGYFTDDGSNETAPPEWPHAKASLAWHAFLLVAYILPVVFLAEQLAQPIDYVIETLHWPAALGGVVIAMLVATPEAIGAIRSATANHLQRSINISLGSVLSTTGLTVPAMLVISHATDHEIYFGLSGANNVILLLTLAVSVVTFASGRTNVLQGAVHVILFAAFLMLIVQD